MRYWVEEGQDVGVLVSSLVGGLSCLEGFVILFGGLVFFGFSLIRLLSSVVVSYSLLQLVSSIETGSRSLDSKREPTASQPRAISVERAFVGVPVRGVSSVHHTQADTMVPMWCSDNHGTDEKV